MYKFAWLMLLCPLMLWANNATKEAIDMARLHKNEPLKAIQDLNKTHEDSLKELYPNYTASPPVSGYYQGNEQTTSPIKEDAAYAASRDEMAGDVKNANQSKERVQRDEGSFIEDVKHSAKVISKTASANIEEINHDLVDCTKPRVCKTDYIQKQCQTASDVTLQYCQQKLNIDVLPHRNETHYPIRISVSMHEDNHNYGGLKANVWHGKITWSQPREGRFVINGSLPQNIPCQEILGSYRIVRANSLRATVDSIRYPTCADPTLDLHMTSNKKLNMEIEIDLRVVNRTREFIDRWENSCQSFEAFLHCEKVNETCVIENETRNIEGAVLSRPCWLKELSYRCQQGQLSSKNTCAPLIDQGCQLIASICHGEHTAGKGDCKNYLQTYNCPVTTCMDTSFICNPQTYCEGSNCGQSGRMPDPDFGTAASKLSAAFDSGFTFDKAHVFAGKPLECNQYALSTVDCCADKGWLLQTTTLFQCGQEAIELGKAKEEGRAVYVGHYAETVNLKDINVYCVFPTKLARIVQEQGRRNQLRIYFGDAKHPDCRGLTPIELQRLDFGQIDFRDYISDLQSKFKGISEDELNKKIQGRLHEMANKGKPYVS